MHKIDDIVKILRGDCTVLEDLEVIISKLDLLTSKCCRFLLSPLTNLKYNLINREFV